MMVMKTGMGVMPESVRQKIAGYRRKQLDLGV